MNLVIWSVTNKKISTRIRYPVNRTCVHDRLMVGTHVIEDINFTTSKTYKFSIPVIIIGVPGSKPKFV